MLSREERGIPFPYEYNTTSITNQAIQAGQVLFNPDIEFTTISGVWRDYCALLALEETPFAVGMPNVNGGDPIAFSRQNAAISKASKNKANAYELIKIMMSNTIQSDFSTQSLLMDIPIRNESRKIKIEVLYQADANRVSAGEGMDGLPISDEQVDEIYDLFTNVQGIKNHAVPLNEMLWDSMKPYFDGTESYDKCVKNLENELKLYVAE